VAVAPSLADRFDQVLFDALYRRSLVYNACWEDPAVDREALRIGPSDRLLVITSAGCNALDYALTGPLAIHAVDANPRQNALLELKLAGIRHLGHGDFFALFGDGHHPRFVEIYRDALRRDLSPFAQSFWDERAHWFTGRSLSFYFRGLSGYVARAFRSYFRLRPRLREDVHALFESRSLEEQRIIYEARIQPAIWGRGMNWMLSRQITMSLLGVPSAQRREVEAQHAGGVASFVREAIEYVAQQLPLSSNYFYSVYLRGRYTRDCCPEYLKPDNFARLKDGLGARIEVHTGTVTGFLRATPERFSRFVLLDHMDWMSCYRPAALAEEWEAIFERATPDARLIFRSAHARPSYLAPIRIGSRALLERLRFHPELAEQLHRRDRVHTYAGFHIADVLA